MASASSKPFHSPMDRPLPSGFVSIANALVAPEYTFQSVIGIAVRPGEDPYMTRRGEYMITFALADPAYVRQQADLRGFMVRFFHRDIESLPQPKVGDIVVLRDVKKASFQGTPVLLSHNGTSTCIFAASDIPEPNYSIAYSTGTQTMQCIRIPKHRAVTVEEQMYAVRLKKEMADRLPSGPPPNTPSGPRSHTTIQGPMAAPTRSGGNLWGPVSRVGISTQKFSLIKDMIPNKFCDMIVEVIKIFSAQGGGFVELYVSDYTEHRMLYDHPTPEEIANDGGADGDPHSYLRTTKKDWPGPWGQRVLKMEVQYPHAGFVHKSVKEGDYLRIRNARAKLGQSNKLEGNLWADSRWPDRIDISLCRPSNSVECEALVERRKQYWDARPSDVRLDGGTAPGKNREKNRAKKEKKKQKQASSTNAAKTIGVNVTTMTNPNVRCAHGTVQLSSLAELIAFKGSAKDTNGNKFELPFVNQKRRMRVRVIDFFPKALDDFSYYVDMAEHETQSTTESDWQPHFEWDFFLRLEDASQESAKDPERATTWVHLTNESAQYLLKEDAVDLKTDSVGPQASLQEKLFLLWGNLEEVVTAEPGKNLMLQNQPFECCIRELGQELDESDRADPNKREWIRIYEMFGVTID